MAKTKILNVLLGLLYYFVLICLFAFLYMMALVGGYLDLGFSFAVFSCILPLVLLILPVIIKVKFNISFYRSILFSFFCLFIYFVIFGMYTSYFDTFTESKWKNEKYINLRYSMIDDLEKKYNLIGMNKDEVIKILGDPIETKDGEMCYPIGSVYISIECYCLRYGENNIIVDKYHEKVD